MKKKTIWFTLVAVVAAVGGAFFCKQKRKEAEKEEGELTDEEKDSDSFILRNPYSPFGSKFADKDEDPAVAKFQMHLLKKAPITTQIIWRHPEALKELMQYEEVFCDEFGIYDHDIFELFDDIVDEENLSSLIALCYRIETS